MHPNDPLLPPFIQNIVYVDVKVGVEELELSALYKLIPQSEVSLDCFCCLFNYAVINLLL